MRQPVQRPSTSALRGPGGQFLWDLLSFERLMTSQVIHLVYWAGLGIIAIMAFGVLGATVGVAIREGSFLGVVLALVVLGVGLLGVGAAILLWRSFCEFYVTVFKISEDLAVLRQDVEAERARNGR